MIILVMGVSGSGKSTLGRALARSLNWDFVEGDDYHPRPNIEKMRAGLALSDADRDPWLRRLHDRMLSITRAGKNAVVSCSALKNSYRELLSRDLPDLRLVYLCGDPELIRERIEGRRYAFMPAQLLDSQLEALEPPTDALLVPVRDPTHEQVRLVTSCAGVEAPS